MTITFYSRSRLELPDGVTTIDLSQFSKTNKYMETVNPAPSKFGEDRPPIVMTINLSQLKSKANTDHLSLPSTSGVGAPAVASDMSLPLEPANESGSNAGVATINLLQLAKSKISLESANSNASLPTSGTEQSALDSNSIFSLSTLDKNGKPEQDESLTSSVSKVPSGLTITKLSKSEVEKVPEVVNLDAVASSRIRKCEWPGCTAFFESDVSFIKHVMNHSSVVNLSSVITIQKVANQGNDETASAPAIRFVYFGISRQKKITESVKSHVSARGTNDQ